VATGRGAAMRMTGRHGPRAAGRSSRRATQARTRVLLPALAAALLLVAACSATIVGQPMRASTPAVSSATTTPSPTASTVPLTTPTTASPTGPTTGSSETTGPTGTGQSPTLFPTPTQSSEVPDDEVGLKPDAPTATLKVSGNAHTEADKIAIDTLADLFDYYDATFPRDFDRTYQPPRQLVSYDSTDKKAKVCGRSAYQMVNAFFAPSCDTIAWDRGVMLPMMIKDIGQLAPAVVLSHEIGHDVQDELGVPGNTPTIVLEQQADCYAGAYWRWVADGNSKYFNFNQTEGMRQMLLSLFQAHDPVGSSGQGENDHGNGFDRTYAATLGYTTGAVRCSQIDAAEITQRGQEFPFNGIPHQYGNVDITEDVLSGIIDTVNDYFTQTAPGYVAPTLTTFTGEQPPPCQGYTPSYPVSYCPPTNTVSYNLSELQRIGTPTAGWESVNGDFSAIVLLVSRYALAAQASGNSPVTGNTAGLRALCYAGTWATWMRNPQGPQGFQLSPNDLDKAIYEIVSSPLAGSDANGQSSAALIERVQAFDIGVTHLIPECFDFYSG
jgi:predicted metalloprotease